MIEKWLDEIEMLILNIQSDLEEVKTLLKEVTNGIY
jgi:hypothetical protein